MTPTPTHSHGSADRYAVSACCSALRAAKAMRDGDVLRFRGHVMTARQHILSGMLLLLQGRTVSSAEALIDAAGAVAASLCEDAAAGVRPSTKALMGAMIMAAHA